MGAGHSHALYVHGHSRLHRLAPETKVAAVVGFVVAMAVTPREAVWAFALHAAALLLVRRVGQVPWRFVATRILVIVPFVLFAVLIPFIGEGEQVRVAGVSLSREGLWAAWAIIARATLGATASILLAATTEPNDILRGLERLRVPAVFTTIAAFMLRYLQVLVGELGRQRVAMTARGYDPRWLWQVKPIASSAGALFIRSYERGERVHAAMLSRGFDGVMPPGLHQHTATAAQWRLALTLPLTATAVTVVALIAS